MAFAEKHTLGTSLAPRLCSVLPRSRFEVAPEGVSYVLFECLLCGGVIALRLNAEGQIDGEFVISSTRKCA